MNRRSRFRITGGVFKGRPLTAPLDKETRPMQGSVRETLFNVLRPKIDGARVLDLFCGTGSLGLEALSRGAACCTFCEHHGPALAILQKNIASLGLKESVRILRLDLLKARWFPRFRQGPFDIIFLDPPFRFMDSGSERDLAQLISLLAAAEAIAPEAAMVHQLRKKQAPRSSMEGFLLDKEKAAGSIRLAFYEFQKPGGPSAIL